MPLLGIGQLTAIELSAVDYIAVAADAGLDTVSLFFNPMENIQGKCMTTLQNSSQVKEQLRTTGMKVANIEVFPILPDLDVRRYWPALEMGKEMNARGATVLLFDTDEARVIDSLSLLCEKGVELDLRIGVEFMPLAPGWTTVHEAAALVARAGQPNLGLVIDILHLIRSGGSPTDVAAIDPAIIFSAQLCDSGSTETSQDYVVEATTSRLTPGEGCLPLREFLRALPANTPIELEVPQVPELPARERVKAIAEAARAQIRLAGLR